MFSKNSVSNFCFWTDNKLNAKEIKDRQITTNRLTSLYKDLATNVRNCYTGKTVINIEVKNGQVVEGFSDKLLCNLKDLDLKTNVEKLINKCKTNTIKTGFKDNLDDLINHGEKLVIDTSKQVNREFENKEVLEVNKKLSEPQVYNLTTSNISEKSRAFLENGQNFTPPYRLGIVNGTAMFQQNISDIVKQSYKSLTSNVVNVNSKKLVETTLNISQDPTLTEEESQFYKNLVTNKGSILSEYHRNLTFKNKHENSKFILTEREIKNLFSENENSSIIQADKNLGFVNITNDELLNQFEKINAQQHFIPANINENEYLIEITKKKLYISFSMPEETKSKLPKSLYSNLLKRRQNEEIGIMRLMPKIGKLKIPNSDSVDDLTSRGIKSSINDPINDVSEILSNLSKEVLTALERAFEQNFKRKCPIVKGSLQTSGLLKSEKVGVSDWMHSIEVSGDSTDMYSNANKEIVIEAYNYAFQFIKLTKEEQKFMIFLIETVMTYNYFHEPMGIFTMIGGFAMGCHSSAICTELLLLTKEFKMFLKLRKYKLLSVIERYLRFRDDVIAKLVGESDKIVQSLEILITGYPKEIDYNVQIFFLKNEFVDFRFFTQPKNENLVIGVNRKKETKFDIVRGFSATNPKYLNSALYSAAYTIIRNTNSQLSECHERKIYNNILVKRGYGKTQLKRTLFKSKHRVNTRIKSNKKYCGKIMFDSFSNLHMFTLKLVKISKLPESLRTPIVVGNKKTINYVFTKKKFIKTLKQRLSILKNEKK